MFLVASFFILFFNLLIFFKKILLGTVLKFGSKFLNGFFKFFFLKVIVRFYSFYLSIINRIGWNKIRGNFLIFVFGQKLVHVVVALLTISFVYTNLVQGTNARELNDQKGIPIISHFIGSEFGAIEQELKFEEALSLEELDLNTTQNYLGNDRAITNNLRINQNISDEGLIIATNSTSSHENILPTTQVIVKTSPVKRKEIITYIIESGDTISTIAQNFGISVNTILWENNLNSRSLIRPGDKLLILPETGLTHRIKSGDTLGALAKINDVKIDDILEANSMTINSKLSIGQELIIPGANKAKRVPATKNAIKSYTGITAIKRIVAKTSQAIVANKMAWPTVGNRITQYYSLRHTGLDIANKKGTPLFASDTGKIIFVGWSTGYGNNIVIDHGGGKKTRYAHMSKFYVSKGDAVTKGETIGEMGSTGWSTGPHVHFEVIINGVKYNPLNYIR